MLIENGLGMEEFLDDLVKNAGNSNLKIIDSSKGVQTISTAQLLSRTFTHYVMISVGLGVLSAVFGMVISAWFNLPSGSSIVATQLAIFLTAMVLPRLHSLAH